MLLPPKRGGDGARGIAAFQAFALAAFLVGIRPHGSLASAGDFPSRQRSLVTSTDHVETVTISRGSKASDGHPSGSALATEAFNYKKADDVFDPSPYYAERAYRRAIFLSSLIRSPPVVSLCYGR
jgi:hypothetical protein